MMARFRGQIGMREEPKNPEAVIVGDENHALLRERLSVVARFGAGATRKPSAITPHDHRQTVVGRFGRRPNVDMEAILAGSGSSARRRSLLRLLRGLIGVGLRRAFAASAAEASGPGRAGRAEVVGRANAVPFGRGLGSAPAQVAHRRRGIRNAFKDANARVLAGNTGNRASIDLDWIGNRRESDSGREEIEEQERNWSLHTPPAYRIWR